MNRRDLLRGVFGAGTMTAMGSLSSLATAAARSVSPSPKRSLSESLASRLVGSIQKHRSSAVPLRPIGDGHFLVGQGFVTFFNPGSDGRMQHLGSRRRLHKRSR